MKKGHAGSWAGLVGQKTEGSRHLLYVFSPVVFVARGPAAVPCRYHDARRRLPVQILGLQVSGLGLVQQGRPSPKDFGWGGWHGPPDGPRQNLGLAVKHPGPGGFKRGRSDRCHCLTSPSEPQRKRVPFGGHVLLLWVLGVFLLRCPRRPPT